MFKSALLLLLGIASFACNAAPHREVDLRNQSDASGEYAISLCARPSPAPMGLPGHAFVAYSMKPANGPRKFFALGFTTNSAVLGLLSFSSVLATPSGYLGEEKYTAVNEKCLVLLVNEDDFNTAYALALPFNGVPALSNLSYTSNYSLTSNDCMTFMIGTATKFSNRGIVVPERNITDLPLQYLRKIIDAN